MGLFSRPETVILKEGSSAKQQLVALESLRGTLPPAAERQLEADIRAVQAGIVGEDRILYELKNSRMDMFVLQDLYFELDGLTAQIDFLVATPQRNFVLECKNLYGNIEVNSKGEFIRTFNGRKKEGIYSPITQNRRHLELINAMLRKSRGPVMSYLLDKGFADFWRSLVVFANPKTVVNDRYAKKEVKKHLVRADSLIDVMKAINNEKGLGHEKSYKSDVRDGAEWFLSKHKENTVDYAAKYRKLAEDASCAVSEPGWADARGMSCFAAAGVAGLGQAAAARAIMCPICGAPMVLRTARRGPHAGMQFYGCSNYPVCHGIVNVGGY